MIICDRCNKTNTEFNSFDMRVNLEEVKTRMTFSGSRWVKRLVKKYILKLLHRDVIKRVNICQSCTSKMLRGMDKDK
jgi:hypothetical protein